MKMGVLDELEPKLTKSQLIREFIASQPDADEWREAFSNPKYSHASIARLLLQRGCQLGTMTQATNAVHKMRTNG
jgi:hypothetical protein